MSDLYPATEPHRSGMLDVGDGHRIHWEDCGNPDGKPAIVLHGGPGSGCSPRHRRLFDPQLYRVVLFDQRGCGRSRPLAAHDLSALRGNTLVHLVGDIEALRRHLGIDAWLLFGGSWGTTLALAYAQAHADRVTEMVLAGITTTSRAEIDWLYGHIGAMMPAEFEAFQAGVQEGGFGAQLPAAYRRLLTNADRRICETAAADWCRWEAALVEVDPRAKPDSRWLDADFRLTFARIVTHYFGDTDWLSGHDLLAGMSAIAHIPGFLVHSRFDPSAPLATAWRLSRHWPAASLTILDGALHSATSGPMAQHLVAALNQFAERD